MDRGGVGLTLSQPTRSLRGCSFCVTEKHAVGLQPQSGPARGCLRIWRVVLLGMVLLLVALTVGLIFGLAGTAAGASPQASPLAPPPALPYPPIPTVPWTVITTQMYCSNQGASGAYSFTDNGYDIPLSSSSGLGAPHAEYCAWLSATRTGCGSISLRVADFALAWVQPLTGIRLCICFLYCRTA